MCIGKGSPVSFQQGSWGRCRGDASPLGGAVSQEPASGGQARECEGRGTNAGDTVPGQVSPASPASCREPVERDDERSCLCGEETVYLQKMPAALCIGTLEVGSADGILETS